MMRSKPHDNGRNLGSQKGISLSHDTARLYKTQDVRYLNMIFQKTSVARKRLEQEYLFQRSIHPQRKDDERNLGLPNHKYFCASKLDLEPSTSTTNGEKGCLGSIDKERVENLRSQAECGISRLSPRLEDKIVPLKAEKDVRKTWQKGQKEREAKLKVLRRRQKEILAGSEAVEHQRANMANTVGGVTTAGFKWKVRERLR